MMFARRAFAACVFLAPIATANAQQTAARTFHGTGIVTSVEGDAALTINHQPIEGLMPAMEMTFKVDPPALTKGVRPGDKVQFGVEGKTYVIRELKVVGHTE